MNIMNIPRRFLWIAAGALGASAYLYFRKRLQPEESPSAGDQDREDVVNQRDTASPQQDAPEKAGADGDGASEDSSQNQGESPPEGAADALPGGERELSEFLGGESWFDEVGWQEIWEREGVSDPADWLKTAGLKVLSAERKKLADHPALLAGCRRRWIVVSRYADIDVAIAAELWNQTDD
jgi:hypothetical protein